MTRVSDLSEDALLALIVPHLPVSDDAIVPTGDDCAVLAAPDGRVAVSTDMLVEGRHFLRTWSTGADVGWRAAMQNLADAVAMGARPTSLVVSMVLPPEFDVASADVHFAGAAGEHVGAAEKLGLVPGVNYLGRSASIILAGGSEA